MMNTITALVFDNYETLDLFGMVEMFGRLPEHYRIQYTSLAGGVITNQHNVELYTTAVSKLDSPIDILLIVGGQGTRTLVTDHTFLQVLTDLSNRAEWVLSVCTGSALLAKAGILDGKRATSNKCAWDWVIAQSNQVNWVRQARWVVDGKYYTSSGVSAGMDMALGFIADRHGAKMAEEIAWDIEYRWANDPDQDEFGA